jgi:hypothetical protein
MQRREFILAVGGTCGRRPSRLRLPIRSLGIRHSGNVRRRRHERKGVNRFLDPTSRVIDESKFSWLATLTGRLG